MSHDKLFHVYLNHAGFKDTQHYPFIIIISLFFLIIPKVATLKIITLLNKKTAFRLLLSKDSLQYSILSLSKQNKFGPDPAQILNS